MRDPNILRPPRPRTKGSGALFSRPLSNDAAVIYGMHPDFYPEASLSSLHHFHAKQDEFVHIVQREGKMAYVHKDGRPY